MFKRLYLSLLLVTSALLSAKESPLPLVIQFDAPSNGCADTSIASGCSAFNHSPELCPFFEMLRDKYNITTVIETGTYQGSSTAFFAHAFQEVHTIDISEKFARHAKRNLRSLSNIHFYVGSSESILHEILYALQDQFVLFYLDAHWDEYWPLLDELDIINKTHHGRCIVVIDDVKVPGRDDVPYDSYAGKECSYEYAKEKIEQVFDEYEIHYLVPSNPAMRGKLVILPQ